ncbi:hypothetical protein K435DRAFT_810064 [Dendrothele bispora CBS 962.96]|uniref:Uncharacterized protein n=1 Tax=Dendrothele bispora (strain CBS 962.96) TaxID=1314807 RepID=A0A4S8KW71_DENBC|nr:hypothetical protein K435DRAFT_810064 [Dendrothele bispora CBS 962.96]
MSLTSSLRGKSGFQATMTRRTACMACACNQAPGLPGPLEDFVKLRVVPWRKTVLCSIFGNAFIVSGVILVVMLGGHRKFLVRFGEFDKVYAEFQISPPTTAWEGAEVLSIHHLYGQSKRNSRWHLCPD